MTSPGCPLPLEKKATPAPHPPGVVSGDLALFRLAVSLTFSARQFQWTESAMAAGGGTAGHSRNARGRPSSTGQLSLALMLLTPPPCLRFLPSRAPSLAASLLPVVYFLFCYPAEEVGGEYPWSRSPRILCLQDLEGGERGSPGEIPLRCTAGLIEPGVDLPYL